MAGFRKQKGNLTGIALLMFLAALSLTCVLTIYLGGGSYIRQEMQRAGFGDLTAWVSQVPDMEALTESIGRMDGIEKQRCSPLFFPNMKRTAWNQTVKGNCFHGRQGSRDTVSFRRGFPVIKVRLRKSNRGKFMYPRPWYP